MEARDRILVALDVSDVGELVKLAKALGPHVGGFKIGLEALMTIGLKEALNAIRGYGPATENIFVDAKIHDIPTTTRKAIAAIVAHPQVKFVNVHAAAGLTGLEEANKAKGQAKLLAVTLLTSMDADDAAPVFSRRWSRGDETYTPQDFYGTIVQMMGLAAASGADGLICSPREVADLRKHMGSEKLLFITPGVRPTWAAKNDQERVTTPAEAVRNGASYVVIGRPITAPPGKLGTSAAAKLIADEIAEALR